MPYQHVSGTDEAVAALLRGAGMKSTRPRIAVLETLAGSDAPLAAEDVFLTLRERDIPANLSTVYRSLETLAEKGLLSKVQLAGDSRTLFEFSRMMHRHYLVCVRCKSICPIEHCPLESYERALAAQTGYQILSHKLAVYGCCPACQEPGAEGPEDSGAEAILPGGQTDRD